MKMLITLFCLMLGTAALAQHATRKDYGYLKKEDQKYFQNDSREGNNALERMDKTVVEINNMHAKMNGMQEEIDQLKKDIEQLKAANKSK